jgi:hypothetical protein
LRLALASNVNLSFAQTDESKPVQMFSLAVQTESAVLSLH